MKSFLFILLFVIILLISYMITHNEANASISDCEVSLYIANNTFYEIYLNIDGIESGKLNPGANKKYQVNLANSQPKRLKIKVSYNDPEMLENANINYMSKKLECDMTDTIYVAIKK